MNELITTEKINPLVLFSDDNMDPLLDDIERQVNEFEPDLSTITGRGAIASMGHKVARSKTLLDDLGKKLNEEHRKEIDAVDVVRRNMRKRMDDLKVEVLAPLTEWREAEQARIDGHKHRIQNDICLCANLIAQRWDVAPLDAMRKSLTDIEAITMGEDEWQEFAGEAAEAKDIAIIAIKEAITKREAKNAQDAEVERLRKEAEERERADREAEEARQRQAREDEIRREAEAAQKRADEEHAAKVAEEAEARRQDAIRETEQAEERAAQAERDQKEAAAQAERDRVEAAAQAKKDEEFARLQERDRIAAEERAAQEAAAKREADTKHRKTINNAAKDALVFAGISKDDAESVIREIALGNVPNVRISY